jgi:D-alanyl-D-alanine carboxypeptidase
MSDRSGLLRPLALAFGVLCTPLTVHAADSDADGIGDNADNCIEVANADQRDTNADGFGNLCDADLNNDLNVNFVDLGLFKAAFLTGVGDANYDPDADFNGDGFINFGDLGVLKAGFLQPPGPAGDDPGPIGELEVDTLVTPQPICGDLTHHLQVDWKVLYAKDAATVDITVLLPDGHSETRHSTVPTGTVVFDVDSVYGGPATVITTATERSGATASNTFVAELPPCDDNPPPVPPDLGFEGPPDDEPPVIGVPDSKPKEVDVVHLGGSPLGPTPAKIVAAAGTGSGVKLFSYGVDNGTQAPVYLQQAGPFAGKAVKLEVLYPEISPKLEVQPFVAGVIQDDGNLWLSTWQVFSDGTLKKFDTVGYGANAHLHIEDYAIAHRVLDNGHYQVVTPVRTNGDRMRTLSWEIDDDTGDLWGVSDSGDWGDPDANAEPSIAHLDGNLYVVSYRDSNGEMATRYWDVSQSGTPKDAYGAVSGLDHTGKNTVTESIISTVNLPIATDGFLTPVIDAQGSLKLDTWETRFFNWGEGGGSYLPYLVSDSTRDLNSGGFGVSIPLPTLTNATDSTGAFLANVRGLVTDGLIEDDFGVGEGELYSQIPGGELTSIHSASLTKNMTLLIAVEAIQSGEIDEDDPVTISADAANVGGSSMGPDSSVTTDDLQENEVQSLRNLLYGLMLNSANDAGAAIAEHISGASNFETFVARMNLRASELGLDDTIYNVPYDPAAGPVNSVLTTPQDQVTLWQYGIKNDLFLKYASTTMYDACGVDAEGDDRCYFLDKGSHAYPGTAAWKGGNLGAAIPGYSDNGGPYCVGSGCLVAHATRLDRDILVAIQQSGDRWGDADRLWEYGYRTQFTPDHRGLRVQQASVSDFALDSVLDTLGVIAEIDTGGTLSVCTWSIFADGGTQTQINCHRPAFTGVAGGVETPKAALVDGVRISTLLADGDYWTGYRTGTQVNLDLWRVGPKE